jgi:peptide/nickel transport system substrate-binding protein
MKKLHFYCLAIGLILSLSACRKKLSLVEKDNSRQTIRLEDAAVWDPSWSTKDEVKVHQLVEPDNLHPTNGVSLVRAELFLYLHSGLLRVDLREGSITTGIAEAMPQISSDGRQMQFRIRKNVKWDNGSQVTARDVLFTLKATKCPLTNNPSFKSYFDNVIALDEVPGDPLAFTIQLQRPLVQNLAIWADYPILQESLFDSSFVLRKYSLQQFSDTLFNASAYSDLKEWADRFNAPEWGFEPDRISGLGAYRLQQWNQGTSLVLEKKKNHWTDSSASYLERSYPSRILILLNKEPVTQELAFLRQEMEASTSVTTRSLMKLREDSSFNKNYHSRFVDIFGYTYVAINMQPEASGRATALADIHVRKAMALSTPVDDIIRIVNKGVNKRVSGPVSFMKSSYDTSIVPVPFDPVKANRLLDENGWSMRDADGIRKRDMNGKVHRLEFELKFMNNIPEWMDMAMLIKEGMAKSGIMLKLTAVDPNSFFDFGARHDFDLMMGSWNSTALNEDYTQLWSRKSWETNGMNFSGFGTAASDALADSINFTLNESERNAMEYRMQRMIAEQQPYIFLYGLVRRSILHRRFKGGEFYAERPGILYNILSPGIGTKVAAVN